MRATIGCLVALLLTPGVVIAQSEPKPRIPSGTTRADLPARAPLNRPRIANQVFVGDEAPDFELTSSQGRQVRLTHFRGDRVMMCFADRRVSLAPLRQAADSLKQMDVLLVGVCHDSPQSLRTLAERDSLPFELLSDPTGEIAAMYGSYDYLHSSILPGYVMVGRSGVVRMVLLGQELPSEDLIHLTRFVLSRL